MLDLIELEVENLKGKLKIVQLLDFKRILKKKI